MPSMSRNASSTSHLKRSNSNLNSPSSTSLDSDLPPSTDSVDHQDDTKFKQLLAVLKKAIGVKDMGAMRLSLPANLITPIGNLEYWCYLDRPDFFAAIDDSNDDFERMLAVLRWTFTKECKFIHGPICKPYNSVLGEQFRCIYDVVPSKIDPDTGEPIVFEASNGVTTDEDSSDPVATRPSSRQATSTSTAADSEELTEDCSHPTNHCSLTTKSSDSVRVVFLNEQVSHHPPISCFWYESRSTLDGQSSQPKPRVIAHGIDQISAKFTGTSVKVFPGPMNKGIFIKLPNRNEEYEVTHPTATISGLIRANPYVAITNCSYITCRTLANRRFRTIISYLDESWMGKAKFALEGVIYVTEDTDEEWTKIKQVPAERIWCKFSGSWRGLITYTMTENSQRSSKNGEDANTCTDQRVDDGKARTLIDLSSLFPLAKTVKPEENQVEMESRKFWTELTSLIKAKNFGEATKVKQTIEQNQRDLSNERKSANRPFKPFLFQTDDDHPGSGPQDGPGSQPMPSFFPQSDKERFLKHRLFQDGYTQFSKPKLTVDGLKILDAEFNGVGYTDQPVNS